MIHAYINLEHILFLIPAQAFSFETLFNFTIMSQKDITLELVLVPEFFYLTDIVVQILLSCSYHRWYINNWFIEQERDW